MSAKYEELAETLTEELELTTSLLDLAKDARAAIVSADPELLVRIVAEQEERSARLEETESRRIASARALGDELGLEGPGAPRLKDIVERAPEERGTRLLALGRRLKGAASQLRALGESNAALLQDSLEHVDHFFSVFVEACRQPTGYSAPGAQPRGAAAAVLDQQA